MSSRRSCGENPNASHVSSGCTVFVTVVLGGIAKYQRYSKFPRFEMLIHWSFKTSRLKIENCCKIISENKERKYEKVLTVKKNINPNTISSSN